MALRLFVMFVSSIPPLFAAFAGVALRALARSLLRRLGNVQHAVALVADQ